MSFSISNEPITGKARVLHVLGVNLSIRHQVELQDTDGTSIIKGEEKSFNLGGFPHGQINEEVSTHEKNARAVLQDKIEEAFAEYFNVTLED